MSDFESYIRNNKHKLDIDKPDEEYLWAGISQSLNKPQKKKYLAYWKYAAAAVLLIVISSTITSLWYQRNSSRLLFENIDPILAQQEALYLKQIDEYSNLLKKTQFNPDDLATGTREVQYIDDLIKYYSEDLKANGPNPRLLNSLMDLYQKKILILERMLNEIEKKKNHEKRSIKI